MFLRNGKKKLTKFLIEFFGVAEIKFGQFVHSAVVARSQSHKQEFVLPPYFLAQISI